MQNRRLLVLAAIVSVFALGVLIWYVFFSTPQAAPSLGGTKNPLPTNGLPARFGFIFQDNNPPATTTETEVTNPGPEPFVQIWDKPATGNTLVMRQVLREVTSTSTSTTSPQVIKTIRATSSVLMFVDRTTGYVYGYSTENGHTYQISNTTIPGIYDAYIFAGGDRILLRYLDSDRTTIKSILAGIPNVQEGRDPQGLVSQTNLPNNITSVAVNPSLSSLSYVVSTDGGASVYTVTAKGVAKVADSPFSEWKLSYGGEKLYATTLPSAYLEGTTVSLPSFSRVIGGKTGLMSLPSSDGSILNSMWSGSGLATFGSNKGSTLVMDIRTLADKCAATGAGQFVCGVPDSIQVGDEGMPDDWYQGKIAFKDSLKMVSLSSGSSFNLYSFPEKYGSMDVTHIQTNKQADLISFIRKNDGTLWLLNMGLLAD